MGNAVDEQPYYDTHIFCCINERPQGHKRGCCSSRGAQQLQKYMKARAKELGIPSIRINKSGCLDRCELGPVMVVYPQGVWYRYSSQADVDAILQEHIQQGTPVERLRLANDAE